MVPTMSYAGGFAQAYALAAPVADCQKACSSGAPFSLESTRLILDECIQAVFCCKASIQRTYTSCMSLLGRKSTDVSHMGENACKCRVYPISMVGHH